MPSQPPPLEIAPAELALPRDRVPVAVCHAGVRFRIAARHLRASGFDRVASLSGGLDAWKIEIDRDMPRY